MRIGVPKESKPYEYRVALTPEAVEECRAAGHEVWVEKDAGEGSGIRDREFQAAGARILESREKLFKETDLIVKVKELQKEEIVFLPRGAVLWGYFHFAANPWLLTALRKRKTTALAYETLREKDGGHPLLTPMSEVAGKMAVQEGAKYLERAMGGRGILLGGAAGVAPAKVVVIGAGVVGGKRRPHGRGARRARHPDGYPHRAASRTAKNPSLQRENPRRGATCDPRRSSRRRPSHRRGLRGRRSRPEGGGGASRSLDETGVGDCGRGYRPRRVRGNVPADNPWKPCF